MSTEICIKESIPFLKLIPKDVFLTLNFDEFYIPNHELNLIRTALEKEFDCYIMCYQLTATSNLSLRNLCHLICPATLNKDQIVKLMIQESKFNDIVFVAYEKPLKFKEENHAL